MSEVIPRVKDAFDRVYRETGFKPTSKIPNDPESKVMLEQEARKRALAHLQGKDRAVIDSCAQRLKDCSSHVGLGDSAALQILEHLGIFFLEVMKGEGNER